MSSFRFVTLNTINGGIIIVKKIININIKE